MFIVYVLQFTIQLALCGLAEYVLHLSRLNPDMMHLHQDSGFLNVSYFKFDIDDTSGKPLTVLFCQLEQYHKVLLHIESSQPGWK